MSKFNQKYLMSTTKNLAGGTAYAQDLRMELASILLTTFLSNDFYRSGSDTIERIRELVKLDPTFAARAAVMARNEFGMRSVSHVVAGEVVQHVKGEQWVKEFINAVVRRPDDMLEILGYRQGTYGLHPLPNSLKKGFRLAFNKFGGYQLAKYRGEGKSIKLIDVVNLVKPIPTERNAEALKALVNGELKNEQTWEARLSSGEDKAQVWKDLLSTNQLGYMALLRNLRNMMEQADSVTWEEALKQLVDPERIHKSLVLPFRYYSAYQMIQQHGGLRQGEALSAISRAATIACDNVPQLSGRTLVALDTSGSMTGARVSDRSGMTVAQLGALFASVLKRRMGGRVDVMTFDTSNEWLGINPDDSLLTITDNIVRGMRGGGTNMDLVFDHNESYDRVIVLSDMQAWTNGRWGDRYSYGYRHMSMQHDPAGNALDAYKKRTGANPDVYAFDLKGYGSMQFPASKCYQLAGWSEKVFDLMPLLETDRNALVNKINEVDF